MIWSLYFLRCSFCIFSTGNGTLNSIPVPIQKTKAIIFLGEPKSLPGFPEVSLHVPRGHCANRIPISSLSALKFPNTVWINPRRWYSATTFCKRYETFSKELQKGFEFRAFWNARAL